ncbi:MAG: N-6 DNA methylase [Caldisericales bacterium]|nr:N-6 DNA methylase [Caldisericales bacterium]
MDNIITINDILKDSDNQYSLSLFSKEEIDAIKIFDKKGKPYLKCFVKGIDRPAKPEEIVRQAFLYRLLNQYHYPPQRIDVERGVYFGSQLAEKRADIVIFDKDDPESIYVIVELKKPKRTDGLEQLKSYCNAEGASIGVWTNGSDIMYLHRAEPNTFKNLSDIPTSFQTLNDLLTERWTLDKLNEENSLKNTTLKDIILTIENLVLANAGVDAFDEVFKLIWTKLFDEMNSRAGGKNKNLEFNVYGSTPNEYKERINNLFNQAKKKWPGIFLEGEKIDLTPTHLVTCGSFLESVKLTNSNLQIIDEAFEYLSVKSAKGEKGQYFTPRHVIDMCVRMLNPKIDEYVIDPACGSCGFTVHAFFHVWGNMFRPEGPSDWQKEYASNNVFGIDFDARSVKIAKALNLIAGDGRTNVFKANSLDPKAWDEDTRVGMKKRLFNFNDHVQDEENQKNFRYFDFDVLFTNPPFAGDIKESKILNQYDLARKSNGKLQNSMSRDVLFIERCLELVKPGGRLCMVLPQGRFNNSSDEYVRRYIADKARILAVVSLHGNTFKPHTGTKTSVIFLQKWNDDKEIGIYNPKLEDYPIFMAVSEEGGKDNSGNYIYQRDDNGNYILDNHNHKIVKHDLFTISDKFVEFAKEQKMPFWVELSEDRISFKSKLECLPNTWIVYYTKAQHFERLDPEFWHPKFERLKQQFLEKNALEYANNLLVYNSRGLQPDYINDGEILVVNSQHLGSQYVDVDSLEHTNQEFWDRNPRSRIFKNDILLYTTGAYLGRTNIWLEDKKAIASNHVNILRVDENKCNPVYLAFYLNSEYGVMQSKRWQSGSGQQEIYPSDIGQMMIYLPPKDVQDKISENIIDFYCQLKESKKFLEVAKKAVEIAIEESEEKAMQYLNKNQATSIEC